MNGQQRPAELLRQALAAHRVGHLREAEIACRQLLAAAPAQPDALHLLGVIAYQIGRPLDAETNYRKALQLRPDYPEACNSLGVVLYELGRPTEAEANYREALRLRPNYAEAHNNLGNALCDLGRPAQGEASFREALRLRPGFAEAHNGLGNALRDLGRPEEAEASYREALRLRPDLPEAHNNLGLILSACARLAEAEASYRTALRLRPNFPAAQYNLGNALRDLGRPAEAEASYREALRLRPNLADAHLNLGNLLRDLGRPEEAEASYREALRLRPDYPEACNSLGTVFCDLGHPEEAEASYREALRLRPNFPEAHNNLGSALGARGRLADAETSCREALRLRPDFAQAHYNLGLALLLAGRFAEGWREYEWRSVAGFAPRTGWKLSTPLWGGEAIGDRIILLHAEQGLGDTLQFCRYVPLVAARGKTILEVQAPLVRLLSRLPGITELVARGNSLPHFDVQCPLLSLPHAFGTTIETIPADVPYLAAEAALVEEWRNRIGGDGVKIGICWQGNPSARVDRGRSIPLRSFRPIAAIPGVRLISLQKQHGLDQLADLPPGMAVEIFADLDSGPDAFVDTAAVIANLDLVITSDTSIAHLAGALGRPVWVALTYIPDWRWMLDRPDSPWYPTARLFRQRRPGEWDEVLGRIAAEVRMLASPHGDGARETV